MGDETGFIRSSFCTVGGCVEVASRGSDEIVIRDSGHPADVLVVSRLDWQLFVAGVRRGDFDVL